MIVYVSNKQFGEVAGLFDGKVSYRNPKYWKGEVEKCDKCYVHGDYPNIKEAYKDKLVKVDNSQNYTIAELREIKDSIDDWDSFIKGDNRKSIESI